MIYADVAKDSEVVSLVRLRDVRRAAQADCGVKISSPTIAKYIDHLVDSFLYNRAERWDVKDKRYLSCPSKYYSVDLGMRNARLNFRQVELSHLMGQ